MLKAQRFPHVSQPGENKSTAPKKTPYQEHQNSLSPPKKRPRKKTEEQPCSVATLIEKHLRQAEKEHGILWKTTLKSLSEVAQIIQLLHKMRQPTDSGETIARSPLQKKSDKAGQNARKILNEENHRYLEALLKRRLNCLNIIKGLLHSSNFITEKNIHHPENEESPESKKILIVDDDPISTKLTSHFLQKAEYSVTCAADGKEGLQKAIKNPPDIILIDIMMPGLDGFQLLAHLKKEAKTSSIPVLILSSLSNENEIIRGLKAGAMDYITKPFSPQVLLAKIEKTIDLKR